MLAKSIIFHDFYMNATKTITSHAKNKKKKKYHVLPALTSQSRLLIVPKPLLAMHLYVCIKWKYINNSMNQKDIKKNNDIWQNKYQ